MYEEKTWPNPVKNEQQAVSEKNYGPDTFRFCTTFLVGKSLYRDFLQSNTGPR